MGLNSTFFSQIVYLCISIFCTSGAAATPCTPYTLTDNKTFSVHWNYFYYFKDTSNSCSIETLHNSTNIQFTRFPSGAPSITCKPYTHWIRISAHNPFDEPVSGTLVFDDANIYDLTFFHLRPDTTISLSTGTRYPYYHRDINDSRFAFSCQFPPKCTSTIYLKCIGDTYLGLPVSLTDNATFRNNADNRNLSNGLVFGIILFFGVSALFFSIIYHDMNYLYFALFILFYTFMLTIRDGFSYRYFWPLYPFLQQHLFPLAFAISSVASVLFSLRFLCVNSHQKLVTRIANVLIGGWILFMLISIIDPRYLSGLILNPMIAATLIFIPLLAVLNHQYLDKPSQIYVYIWSIFIVVVLLRAIFFSFALQGPPMLMHFFHTGYNQHYLLVFVALFTSLAIGFRVQKMQIESNAAILEASILRQKTLELQLSNLQARIQPHFLYNILNTIANLVFVNAKKAEKAIVELSTFYRTILKHVMHNTITLDKEMDIVIRYLYLEKIRFGKRLSYSISFDKECQNVKIPAMAVQVLVENSLKHGIHPKIDGGSVTITVKKIGNRCEIIVADTGIGLTNEKNGNGTGLKTLHDRLDLVFSGDFLFEIKDIMQNKDTTGVIVTINIPCSFNHALN